MNPHGFLRKHRIANGESQEQVAERLSVTRQHINQIEMGKKSIPKKKLNAYADAYKIDRKVLYLAMIEAFRHELQQVMKL